MMLLHRFDLKDGARRTSREPSRRDQATARRGAASPRDADSRRADLWVDPIARNAFLHNADQFRTWRRRDDISFDPFHE
jgi:hypothetical protein